MDEAGTGVVGDKVIAREEFAGAIADGMLVFERLEVVALEAANDLVIGPTAFLRDGGEEHGRDDELFLADLNERVIERRIETDREVRGKRPRRGGPDDDVDAGATDDGEFD